MNYQTVVTFDPYLKDAWFTDTDTMNQPAQGKCFSGVYINPGTPTNVPHVYIGGAVIYNAADSTVYYNSGSIGTPNFVPFGSGGSGITGLTGDVFASGTGSVPATVIGWDNKKLDSTAFSNPAAAGIPVYDNGTGKWFNFALSGDISGGTGNFITINAIKSQILAGSGLVTNQTYVWDGAALAPHYVPSNNSPVFANNAAALGGGLTAGQFYIADGTDLTIVKGTTMRVY